MTLDMLTIRVIAKKSTTIITVIAVMKIFKDGTSQFCPSLTTHTLCASHVKCTYKRQAH